MTAIRTEGLYKVFGRRPAEAVRQLRAGASRDEVKPHGTAAVIDVAGRDGLAVARALNWCMRWIDSASTCCPAALLECAERAACNACWLS